MTEPTEPKHPAVAWKNEPGAFYRPLPGQKAPIPANSISRNPEPRQTPPASNLGPMSEPEDREAILCRICGLEILTPSGMGKPCLCMVNHSIPRGLRHARITDFKVEGNRSVTRAYDEAVAFVDVVTVKEAPSLHPGLYVFGPPGAGKSHLAAAIVNAILAVRCGLPRPGVTFWPVVETLADIRANMGNGLAAEIQADLDDSANRDVVMILDDLGAERLTEFGADLMATVIRKRTNAQKPLIVTGNLPLTRPEGYNGPVLADVLDAAITSRLAALRQIALFGKDRRTERTKDQ